MPKIDRRGHEFWAQLVGEFEDGGAVEEHRRFADRHGVKADTFRRWLYKLRAEKDGGRWRSSHERKAPPGTTSPWPLVEVGSAEVADGRFEIDLPGGRRLRVPESFDTEALRRLLAIFDEKPGT